MKYRIILVHGTFAPNASWTHPDSPFCQRLRKNIDGDISIESFNWSGGNSHHARTRAAGELALLLKQITADSDAENIVIAHSHGGNIALYALRKLGAAAESFSLVTMATPYLNLKKRDYNFYVGINLFLIPVTLCSLLLWLVGTFFIRGVEGSHVPAYLATLAACIYLCRRLLLLASKLIDKLDGKVENAISDLSFASSNSYKRLLAVIDVRDEITIWFRLLSTGWKKLIEVQSIIFMLITFIAGRLIFSAVDVLFKGITSHDFYNGAETNTLSGFYALFVYSLLFVAAFAGITLSTAIILSLFKSNTLILGRESWFQKLFINITPAPMPSCHANLTYLRYKSRSVMRSLRHSIYNDETVVDHISTWILNKGIPLDGSHKQMRIAPTVTLDNFRKEPEKIVDMAVLFLAANINLRHELKMLELKEDKELDSFIDSIKSGHANDIANVRNSTSMRGFNDVIAILCSNDRRALAEIMYMRITGKPLQEPVNYVDQIIKDYNIDMSREKRRLDNQKLKEKYRIPAKVGVTLMAGTVLYFLLYILDHISNIDPGQYRSGILGPFFDGLDKLHEYRQTGKLMDQLHTIIYFLMFTWLIKFAISLITIFTRPGDTGFYFRGKSYSVEYILMCTILIECIIVGACFGFQPLGSYLSCIIYLVVPSATVSQIIFDLSRKNVL